LRADPGTAAAVMGHVEECRLAFSGVFGLIAVYYWEKASGKAPWSLLNLLDKALRARVLLKRA